MKKKKAGKKSKKDNDNLKLLYLFIGAVFLLGAALYIFTVEEKSSATARTPDKGSVNKASSTAQPITIQPVPARPTLQPDLLPG